MMSKTKNQPKNEFASQILLARRDLIIYKLKNFGYTLSDIAADLRVSQQAVSNALRTPYPRIEKAISEILGEPAETLFPERYDSRGRSLRRRGRPRKKDTTAGQEINTNDSREPRSLKNEGEE